jgi:plasmid maintenance system antidote protein VapI
MMSGQEMEEHLQALRLTQAEAAQLLGVSPRTVTRWCTAAEAVTGPAEAALRAWRKLDARQLAWRPDSVSIQEDDAERIATHRQEAINLDQILRRVESRGGPQLPWSVSLPEAEATLGRVHVSFYKLRSGGFSLSVYRRRDGIHPDLQRDWPLVEDAAFCIAQEFEKHRGRAVALKAVAADVRSKSHLFGERGPRLLDAVERAERQRTIEEHADRIDALAERAAAGQPTTYRQFAAIFAALSNADYSPPPASFVSGVARSYAERRARIRILLVRAGSHETPVTKAIESDEAQVRKLVAGHRLKHLGARLPVLGESGRLASYTGPEHVVLEIPPGANIPGTREPGLYLVIDLPPEQVSRLQ